MLNFEHIIFFSIIIDVTCIYNRIQETLKIVLSSDGYFELSGFIKLVGKSISNQLMQRIRSYSIEIIRVSHVALGFASYYMTSRTSPHQVML